MDRTPDLAIMITELQSLALPAFIAYQSWHVGAHEESSSTGCRYGLKCGNSYDNGTRPLTKEREPQPGAKEGAQAVDPVAGGQWGVCVAQDHPVVVELCLRSACFSGRAAAAAPRKHRLGDGGREREKGEETGD